jgi:uncharacterized membrane protein
MPVPDSDTLSGVLVALVGMLNFADLLPIVFGANLTSIVPEAPAETNARQSLVCSKCGALVPTGPIPVTAYETEPLLLSVAVSVALV